MNIILETNYTEKFQEEPTHKHVLKMDGNFIIYNQIDNSNIGWQTRSFLNMDNGFEKALKFFLKKIAEDRKTNFTAKNLQILTPKKDGN